MKRAFVIVLLCLAVVRSAAQSGRTSDLGAIVSAEASVGLGGPFGVSVEEELRFNHSCTQFNRWLNSVGVDYTCLHNRMNIGFTVDYIRRHNDKGYYENRGRLGLQATYAEEYRQFKFQVRTKLIGTFFDPATGEHRVNPKLYCRNRLKVIWQPMNSRFKYALSTELFWLTNDPKGSYVDNVRTILSVDYRLSRRYWLSAFVSINNELQVKEPEDIYYLGMTLKGKF